MNSDTGLELNLEQEWFRGPRLIRSYWASDDWLEFLNESLSVLVEQPVHGLCQCGGLSSKQIYKFYVQLGNRETNFGNVLNDHVPILDRDLYLWVKLIIINFPLWYLLKMQLSDEKWRTLIPCWPAEVLHRRWCWWTHTCSQLGALAQLAVWKHSRLSRIYLL